MEFTRHCGRRYMLPILDVSIQRLDITFRN